MTVDYGWNDEIDSDSTASEESLDAYVDIDSGTIRINAEQLASHNFDGGIPRSVATNPYSSSIKNILSTSIKRGDYVYLTITPDATTNELVGSFLAADESEVDDDADESVFYNDNLHLVLDIEYSDETEEAPLYIYLYLEIDGERTKVRIPGKVTKTISGSINQSTITVSPDNTGLTTGMLVTGTGINTDTVITNIVGTSLTLNKTNTGAVSGTGTFITAFSVVREGYSLSDWDAGTEGWLLTSAGNAIFSNVLVRGTVDASIIQGSTFRTTDSSGNIATEIPTTGLIKFKSVASSGTQYSTFITIDNSDGDISSATDSAGLNLYNYNSSTDINDGTRWYKFSFDVNELQMSKTTNTSLPTTDPTTITATNSWTGSGFSINPFGGNITLGAASSTVNVPGTLSAGSFSPSSVSTGALTASGTVNFSTAGTITLGADGVVVNISEPASPNTGRALNVGGNAGISHVFTNELTALSNTSIVVNNSFSVNGNLAADYVGAPRFVSLTNSNINPFIAQTTAAAITATLLRLDAVDTGGYDFTEFRNSTTFSDPKFRVSAVGNAFCDGSFTGGGADYAEYFEWEDGNPNSEDRTGYSVSLINNKIKIAQNGDSPIGIVSSVPAVVGDSSWNMWKEKYLKDEFNRLILEEYNVIRWTIEDEEFLYIENEIPEGINIPENFEIIKKNRPILNPEYNPNLEYIPRQSRKEWSPIGLVGKLRMRKGQPVAPSWIKLRDISENIEEWLVK